ncbi:MAG: hypothetical protein HP048_05955 [Clostridia bacterium]|nr:hypothetical protein [Clostridia bacterium]
MLESDKPREDETRKERIFAFARSVEVYRYNLFHKTLDQSVPDRKKQRRTFSEVMRCFQQVLCEAFLTPESEYLSELKPYKSAAKDADFINEKSIYLPQPEYAPACGCIKKTASGMPFFVKSIR